VSLDLAWTSIPAFERVYGSSSARRVAVPPKVDRRVSGAAGGTVLEAAAGMFPRVLVFDFRSLYPSIMRTFNVDPLAYAKAEARQALPTDIVAPNGARFDRTAGIMPALIAEYALEREKALAAGDEVAAYVYKILQNSFYGVLGAEGCRYARTEIAGAITSFGKKFLTMSRDFFEDRGLRVLYGDTDSVFVLSGKGESAGYGELMDMGAAAAEELNLEIAQRVKDEYALESLLRIRCEKAYSRFLIPRLKSFTARLNPSAAGEGEAAGGEPRSGQVEGLRRAPPRPRRHFGRRGEGHGGGQVGLHASGAATSRSKLLGQVFSGAGEMPSSASFAFSEAAALRRGERDERARIPQDASPSRRRLRLGDAAGARRPAHGLDRPKRGRVSYVMTLAGAEPVDIKERRRPGLRPLHRASAPAHRGVHRRRRRPRRLVLARCERPQIELDFGS
jgi:hypothetical protein